MVMNTFIRMIGVAVLPLVSLLSCDDEPAPVEEEYVVPEEFLNLECPVAYDDAESDDIIGTWRLVRTERYDRDTQQSEWKDYSCSLIFYHFQADGKLVVESSVEEEIPSATYDYSYQPYQKGYTIVEEDGAELIVDPGPNLMIDPYIGYSAPVEKGTLSMGPWQDERPNLPQIAEYASYLLRVE